MIDLPNFANEWMQLPVLISLGVPFVILVVIVGKLRHTIRVLRLQRLARRVLIEGDQPFNAADAEVTRDYEKYLLENSITCHDFYDVQALPRSKLKIQRALLRGIVCHPEGTSRAYMIRSLFFLPSFQPGVGQRALPKNDSSIAMAVFNWSISISPDPRSLLGELGACFDPLLLKYKKNKATTNPTQAADHYYATLEQKEMNVYLFFLTELYEPSA